MEVNVVHAVNVGTDTMATIWTRQIRVLREREREREPTRSVAGSTDTMTAYHLNEKLPAETMCVPVSDMLQIDERPSTEPTAKPVPTVKRASDRIWNLSGEGLGCTDHPCERMRDCLLSDTNERTNK